MKFVYIIIILIFFPFSSFSQTSLNKLSTGLSYLWGISVLNDKEILLTQRNGNIFKLNILNKNIIKIKGVPKVVNFGQGGLLDIVVEDINKNKKVYLCLSDKINKTKSATAIHSYDFKNNKLFNKKLLFISNKPSNSSRHFGCRLAIKGEFIFATIGDRGSRYDAQNFANHSGSVIKIKKNGSKHNNNAFKNALPEIYSIGHRNPQGLFFNNKTNQLLLHEHGPQGGDEINIIYKGKNYGWPKVTFGKEYGTGRKIGIGVSKNGFENPVKVWIPSIAPSGMIIYRGDMFAEFKNKLILGSLKFKRLHILTIKNKKILDEKVILEDTIGRIRDIEEMSDGSLIIINDEYNGGVYRLYNE
ncbi:PQQ-dependent sugar dehydrogenase [Alphaproteobacteria bacterium]|nr:PQQ-dependent sugar dehydrogenase [Alphaproteobacteria bacterium]